MRILIGLIFFSLICLKYSLKAEGNFILCTTRCSPLKLPFSDASTLPLECQEIGAVSDAALICSVDYRIDYLRREISVEFQAFNESEQVNVEHKTQYFHQKLVLHLNPDESHYSSDEIHRRYVCNTKNDCAREFYLKTIETLTGFSHSEANRLKSKLYNSSLLMGETSRRRCIDSHKTGDKPSVRCPTGLCHLHYRHQSKDSHEMKIQNCTHDVRATLTSELEFHENSIDSGHNENLEYRCNKNVCNRNEIIPIVRDVIRNLTQWESNKQEIPRIETKQTRSSAMKSLLCSSSLVVFAFIAVFF